MARVRYIFWKVGGQWFCTFIWRCDQTENNFWDLVTFMYLGTFYTSEKYVMTRRFCLNIWYGLHIVKDIWFFSIGKVIFMSIGLWNFKFGGQIFRFLQKCRLPPINYVWQGNKGFLSYFNYFTDSILVKFFVQKTRILCLFWFWWK